MANNSNKGLASADEQTRQRVASEGGQASHGGGRQSDDSGSKGGQSGNQQNDDQGGNRQSGGQGFASMDPEEVSEIASKGGQAAHDKGTAHEWDSEEAAEAGHKGGSK